MRLLLLAVATPALLAAQPSTAREADIVGLLGAAGRARMALAELPALWGFDARDVEWIFTDGRRHLATARVGDRDTLRAITLPAGTPIANTAVTAEDRRWAMVVVNLARPDRASVSLLVHEAMHTFQPERLPAPGGTEPGDGGDLLDGPDGRAWLFLELRALGAALRSDGDARRDAARDALLFRVQRLSRAVEPERRRLEALDLHEGIPEYTGLRLSGLSDTELASRLAGVDTLPVSWVRAISYWTGPAYGFLLDRIAAPEWRARLRQGTALGALLTEAVGAPDGASDPDARAERYGGGELFARERARAAANVLRLDSLRNRFVNGAVLRLRPGSLQISFDPNGQTPLANDGTVMRNFRWAGPDGAELVAADGALVAPGWDWIQVPLGSATLPVGTLAAPLTLEAPGWRLALPAGWTVTRDGNRTELRPPITPAPPAPPSAGRR